MTDLDAPQGLSIPGEALASVFAVPHERLHCLQDSLDDVGAFLIAMRSPSDPAMGRRATIGAS
jgi:hypothetical protein